MLPFVELALEQIDHRVHRGGLVGAVGAQRHRRAEAGGEHHHAHDAFRVDFACRG